ncbi:MAG: glycosyltransferase family 2 protein [Gammaproteobacteria bacterium]|nr:glycosyltransferase family 2 protein [Gammaproteobacteria bacterium]
MVDIIIVTYFSAKQIRDCVESLAMQTIFSQCRIWIVDNASKDETLAVCEKLIAPNITLIPLQTNIGFGRAVNEAAKYAAGEFIYLLNPDAILKTKDDLAKLIEFANAHPSAGVIGSRVVEPTGKEIMPRRDYPKEKKMSTSLGNLPGDIAWVIGASLLIRTTVFNQVQGFDPDFFLYGEEVDLCLRVRKQGFEIAWDADVTVGHIGSASADQLPSYQKKVLKMKGLYLFLQKHYPSNEVSRVMRRDARRALFRYCMTRFSSPKKAEGYRAERDVAKQVLSQATVP